MPSMLAALERGCTQTSLVIKVDARTTTSPSWIVTNYCCFAPWKYARRDHYRRATGGRGLPFGGILQDTYQMNIGQIFVAGLPESGGAAPALRRPDRSPGHRPGESVATCRSVVRSQVENGGRRGHCFLICALTSISPLVLRGLPTPVVALGGALRR